MKDPYVVIYYGGDRKQSTVKEEGGRNPRWGDSFQFMRTGDTVLRVQVWDKDTFSADDMIGEGQANIAGIINGMPGTTIGVPVDLFHKGRSAGRVNLSVANGAGMGMGGMYPQQGGMYPQQGYYPQQGGMYPQQGGMYPQQGGMYPPQQGGFGFQGGFPPGSGGYGGWQ